MGLFKRKQKPRLPEGYTYRIVETEPSFSIPFDVYVYFNGREINPGSWCFSKNEAHRTARKIAENHATQRREGIFTEEGVLR